MFQSRLVATPIMPHRPFPSLTLLTHTLRGSHSCALSAQIHFTLDSHEKEVQLFHRLKLYEEDGSPQTIKKPVLWETYEELVCILWLRFTSCSCLV